MSRLYDALKDASGFRQGADGNAAEGVWEALGINGTDTPPVQNDPDVSEAGAPAVVLADETGVFQEEELLDTTTTPLDEPLGTPTRIALDRSARLIPHAMDAGIAEQYRKLRTKIMRQQEEKPFRSLAVTSANPKEGKTVTVLNLGLSFATLPFFRVLVVDGDLRRGALGKWLGVDSSQLGLSNLIDGSAQLENVVLKSDQIPIHFIVRGNSGNKVPDLRPAHLESHFQRITEQYDLVLVDTPPVNLIADAQLLAACCDAVLLVARAFSTTRKAFEKAVQELQPFRLIGTVLNAGTERGNKYYGNYDLRP